MKTGASFNQNILLADMKRAKHKNDESTYRTKSKGDQFKARMKDVCQTKGFHKICDEEFIELVIAFEKIEDNSDNAVESNVPSTIFFEETAASLLRNIELALKRDNQNLVRCGFKVLRKIIENENQNKVVL